jgi:hypothetical protein
MPSGRWICRIGSLVFSGVAVGCVAPDVTFELRNLDRPATLSRLDRVAEASPRQEERPLFALAPQTCSYEKNVVILPLPGWLLATQRETFPDREEAALAMSAVSHEGEDVDLRVEKVELRHTAFWAVFFFREVNEIEIGCSAVYENEGNGG